jgi:hypothetical protein
MPEPSRAILFSGHMIDAADRPVPRFPPAAEPAAARAIAAALDALGAGPDDLGLCQGSCGGDILFAEALLARGGALELLLPFDEDTFLRTSVAFPKPPAAGPDRWAARFAVLRDHPAARVREMPRELGPTPPGADPFERCNAWLLDRALGRGAATLRFLCLWDGSGGDGPGGTQHMIEEVRRHGGRVQVLDTTTLWSVARTA